MVSPVADNTASLSSLPDEVLVEILPNLPFDALQKMRITDKRFYGLISDTPATLLRAMDISQDPRIAVLGAKTLGKNTRLIEKFLELTGMDKWEMEKWNWAALLKNSKYTLDDIGTSSANVRSLDLNQLHRRFQFFNKYACSYDFDFKHFYPNASSNRDLALAVVKRKGAALGKADSSFRKDFEIVLAAVRQFGWNIRFADPSLQTDDTILKAAISNYGPALSYGNSAQKKDPEFVIPAVAQDGTALQDADPSLQDDELIVRIAMLQNLNVVKYASSRLQNKLQISRLSYSDFFVRESMEYFEQVNFPSINNKSFVLGLIEITRGLVFQYLAPSLQDDEDLLKAALIRDARALSFTSDHLKKKYTTDKKAVLDIISKKATFFTVIDPSLQDDEEVLEAALFTNNRDADPLDGMDDRDSILKSASDRLQKEYNNRK